MKNIESKTFKLTPMTAQRRKEYLAAFSLNHEQVQKILLNTTTRIFLSPKQ